MYLAIRKNGEYLRDIPLPQGRREEIMNNLRKLGIQFDIFQGKPQGIPQVRGELKKETPYPKSVKRDYRILDEVEEMEKVKRYPLPSSTSPKEKVIHKLTSLYGREFANQIERRLQQGGV